MELLQQLGINGKLLLAQIINFVVLVFVLYKLAYKPLLRLLDKRSTSIAQSLADAKNVQEQLAASTAERDRLLIETERASEAMLAQARTQAEQLRAQMLVKTKEDLAIVQKRAAEDAEAEKARVLDEAKRDLADIVVSASAKVLGEKMTAEKDRELAERAIHQLAQ